MAMLLSAFENQIRNWFRKVHKSAHEAARQRYLLGQELLDRPTRTPTDVQHTQKKLPEDRCDERHFDDPADVGVNLQMNG